MVRKIVVVAEHSDQLVDTVIVGSEVLIADRPVVTEPVAALCPEVVGAEAQRYSAPVIRSAANHSRPPPHEVSAFRLRERLALELPSSNAGVELAERPVSGRGATPRGLVLHPEHRRVAGVVPRSAGFEKEDVGPGKRQNVGGHSTTSARSDDHDVVSLALRERAWSESHRHAPLRTRETTRRARRALVSVDIIFVTCRRTDFGRKLNGE
jgi:hypothetical protein